MKNLDLQNSSRILYELRNFHRNFIRSYGVFTKNSIDRTDFARAKSVARANEWLKRAKSSMMRAKIGKASPEILYEDLCFDAQQAAEKALKALCIIYKIAFPKTHDIAYLIDLLERERMCVCLLNCKVRGC